MAKHNVAAKNGMWKGGRSVASNGNLVHGNSDPGMAVACAIEKATGGAVRVESWL